VDVYLAIASKRDQRDYAETPIPEKVARRILDAGRLAGNSQNKQEWEFVVVESAKEQIADTVWAPRNVLGARLVIAICGEARPIDVGRCAQNMMLAAWGEAVTSSPGFATRRRQTRSAARERGSSSRSAIPPALGIRSPGRQRSGRPGSSGSRWRSSSGGSSLASSSEATIGAVLA